MGWFILLIGIFWIAIGISCLAATKKTILLMCNLIKNRRRQNLGLISLVLGALFLIAAPATRAPWFILILGILACLKGATILLMPEKDLKAVLDWWLAAPEIVYKGWASLALTLGITMLYVR